MFKSLDTGKNTPPENLPQASVAPPHVTSGKGGPPPPPPMPTTSTATDKPKKLPMSLQDQIAAAALKTLF